jgi:hypothetical protein
MAMIPRRAFVARSAVAMLAVLPARAPYPTKYRVGCLWPVPAPAPRARAALEAGLRDLGWHPGTDILFEHRFVGSQPDISGLTAVPAAQPGSSVRRWGLEGRGRGHRRWGSAGEGVHVASPPRRVKQDVTTAGGTGGIDRW